MTIRLNRRQLLRGSGALAALALGGCATTPPERSGDIFDAHCHIIDPRYPLVINQGYTPPPFALDEYLRQTRPLSVTAGAIVSGSFHGFDQSYLRATLPRLGPRWVGVTQVPPDVGRRRDREPGRDRRAGAALQHLPRPRRFGRRHRRPGHAGAPRRRLARGDLRRRRRAAAPRRQAVEAAAPGHRPPGHDRGRPAGGAGPGGRRRAHQGDRLRRVTMDVPRALARIAERSPGALMFVTDLPSTRARRPFEPQDIELVRRTLGPHLAERALWRNAVELYRTETLTRPARPGP